VSFESTSTLPKGTSLRFVRDVVEQLGYRRCRASPFFSPDDSLAYSWFETEKFRSFTGVYIHVAQEEGGSVSVYTRTNQGRSYYDCKHQNLTIKMLRKRFGGTFVTDFGVGRYLRPECEAEKPDQAGCHLAFQRFGSSIQRADWYLTTCAFPGASQQELYRFIPDLDPRVLSSHLLLPYLVSVFEEYMRSTFVALLHYSPSKEAVLKGARLSGRQLAEISQGALSVEEAFAQNLSFQNVLSASENLRLVDRRIDLAGLLRKPCRRRKTVLLDSLRDMVNRRHAFVHSSRLGLDLEDKLIWRFVDDLEIAIEKFYRYLTSLNRWTFDKGWGRPRGSARVTGRPRPEISLPQNDFSTPIVTEAPPV
jgi:hypothetical protein